MTLPGGLSMFLAHQNATRRGQFLRNIVDNGEQGVSESDEGAPPTTPGGDTTVLSGQIGSFGAGCTMSSLNQSLTQIRTTFARATTIAFARTVIVTRT